MVERTGWLLAVALALCGVATARAQPAPNVVALLPLDADPPLEIYGQPVASELARALGAGSIDVVVVGPKMTVPERARLIVDGRIAGATARDAVTLTIRVRSARDGLVLETLEATAPGLATIDRAAAELAARVLPVVRGRLAAAVTPPPVAPVVPVVPVVPPRPVAPPPWQIVVGGEPHLGRALRAAVPAWSRGLPGSRIELTVRDYRVDAGPVPLARAAVRVRVWQGAAALFDRTVLTDSVVGDRAMVAEAMAQRVAREVLAIVRPHLQRRQ